MSPIHDPVLEQRRPNVQFMNETAHPEYISSSVFSDPSRVSLQASISSSGSSSSGRPTSHHRRRSSVSTRRDSAEMMGVPFYASLASDSSVSEESDTDGFRRRALLALEGGSALTDSTASNSLVVNGFNKVEIPELDFERFDKVPSPSGRNIFQSSTGVLPSKRDSHNRTSIVSKDVQLHTLVEVDEDEDEDYKSSCQIDPPNQSDNGKLGISSSDSFQTNVPLNRPGLKRLTLTTCLHRPAHNSSVSRSGQTIADVSMRKSSLSYRHSSEVNSPNLSQSLTLPVDALPTPELTPVITERPLSPSEQAFLNNNHSSLLARISELERVLLVRTRSASITTTSSRQLSISSAISDAPSDEMLCLVRDLKAERDDLSRDVGVWESRVADLETQVALLTRRVENERRDAWQTREKIKILETENSRLQDDLNSSLKEHTALQKSLSAVNLVHRECDSRLQLEKARRMEAESNLARFAIRNRVSSLETADCGRLRSDGNHVLSAVAGIPTNIKESSYNLDSSPFEAEDELAHYEDEDDGDLAAYSDDSYSDFVMRSTDVALAGPEIRLDGLQLNTALAPQLNRDPSPASGLSLTPPPTPLSNSTIAHQRKSSLETGWSFPIGANAVVRAKEIADPFFDCLSTVDIVPDLITSDMPGITQPNQDKYFFFKAANDDTDDGFTPFVIPSPTLEKGSHTAVVDNRTPRLHRDGSTFTTFDGVQHPRTYGNDRDGGELITTLQQTRSQHDRSAEHGVPERSDLPDVERVNPSQSLTPAMRKPIPSSIPIFTSTPSSPSKSSAQPATPTSIPRMKTAGASGIKSPSRPIIRPVEERIVTHQVTRRGEGLSSPLSRSSAQAKAPSSAKSSSTAMTSLASYLPWSNWTNAENSSSSDASPPPSFRIKYGKLRTTERPDKAIAKLAPLKKSNGVSNSNRADGLSLL